jgi:hypothetical protein
MPRLALQDEASLQIRAFARSGQADQGNRLKVIG